MKDHPTDPTVHGHRAEIHPPKAVAFFQPGAGRLDGNSGLTRAANAVLYIGRNGGYFRQPINDQDYTFDLYLPPRPDGAAEPTSRVEPLAGHTVPVRPRITPYPADNPKALRVVIPLKGLVPHPEDYAAIISGGWTDPSGIESSRIRNFRVTVESIVAAAFHHGESGDKEVEEWHVYIGVNGVWHVRRLDVRKGQTKPLDVTVDLNLHPDDPIHVTACGFEADTLHELIGRASGFTWQEISDPQLSETQRAEIMEKVIEKGLDKNFLGIPGRDLEDDNEPLGLLSRVHLAKMIPSEGTRVDSLASDKKDYQLNYTIRPL
jgi:hypothetical protein